LKTIAPDESLLIELNHTCSISFSVIAFYNIL